MKIYFEPFTVHKRFALTISRGTTAQTTNIWVKIEQDDIEGWGEASPFSAGTLPQTTELLLKTLSEITPELSHFHPLERQKVAERFIDLKVPSAIQAAIDTALHDWFGKKVGLPLWQIWGFSLEKIPPTSVTIGINSPEGAKQRVLDWLSLKDFRFLKIKLGSPEGINADQKIFAAVQEVALDHTEFSVDANGGWSLENAIEMSHWLADRGVIYLEQPLAKGQESDLPALKKASPLPIFVDESCWTSQDIPAFAGIVDGINIKLMKAGGLSEALRMIQTAKACDLQIMFGCYSDSSLANTAMAHLAPCANYLDLDSHLNLQDDPFAGAELQEGLIPPNLPGLGVKKR